MHVQKLLITEAEAQKLLQRYQTHKNYEKPTAFDIEVTRIAKLISKGKMIIKAQGSIVGAGLNEDMLPKLAIARADAPWVRLDPHMDGAASMLSGIEYANGNTSKSKIFRFDVGSFPGIATRVVNKRGHNQWSWKAVMPHIPPDIRPKRGIENYHVLWEAVWERVPPVDPILLRRVGKSDFYMALAQWDLTEIEREVMRGRIGMQ